MMMDYCMKYYWMKVTLTATSKKKPNNNDLLYYQMKVTLTVTRKFYKQIIQIHNVLYYWMRVTLISH